MIVTCVSPGCSARHCSYQLPSGEYMWSVIELQHTCDGAGRRARSYPFTILKLIEIEQLKGFVLPTKGSGLGQLRKIAANNGVDIKQTVTRKFLDDISGITKLDTFTQISQLDHFVTQRRILDPRGTCLLETTGEYGDRRFSSLYYASGAAKEIFPLLRLSGSAIDGMRYKNITGGCILNETSLDANNGLVPLAQMVCYVENKDNCLYFLAQSERDFPVDGPHLRFIDRGKGLVAAFKFLGLSWRACTQHIIKDIREEYASTPKKLLDTVYALARCTTTIEYGRQTARIREDFPTCQRLDSILEYIDAVKEIFVSAWFLDRGHKNNTAITSNPSEQFNSWLDEERDWPLISLFLGIQRKWVQKTTEVCYLSSSGVIV